VIVTTTRAEKDHAFANRADEFLSLPVQQQVLQQVLKRFCEPHSLSCSIRGIARRASNNNQLTILRVITPQTLHLSHALSEANTDVSASVGGTLGAWQGEVYPSNLNYRVLEADDLEQAALLARIWQPDVLLLDGEIVEPIAYLQQLKQYSSLAGLPIVTLDAATTQAANQVEGLSVFPCLTKTSQPPIHALLSVLQVAAGISCEYSVLVVDFAPLVDLPDLSHTLRSEWFQALIQYLHTAGLRGLMVHSWEEVQQQIQQQSVDLVLICLWESKFARSVLTALNELRQQHNLPPVLVMERRFSQSEVREQYPHYLEGDGLDLPNSSSCTDGLLSYSCIKTDDTVNPAPTLESDSSESVESILGAIATNILPSSLSMEELLDNIHQTLLASPIRVHKGEDKA
jgi:CheY-like chemotaxis protein